LAVRFGAAEKQAFRCAVVCCPPFWRCPMAGLVGCAWAVRFGAAEKQASGVPSYAFHFGAARRQASGVHGLSILALLKSRLPVCHPMLSVLALPGGRPQVCIGYLFWRCGKAGFPVCTRMLSVLALPDGRPQVASASRPNFSNKELRSNELWVRTMFDFALSYSRSRVGGNDDCELYRILLTLTSLAM
jgi:hypothetical protein